MGLLHRTAQIAEEYLATVRERRVGATLGFEDVLADARRARCPRRARTPRTCSRRSPRWSRG